MGDPDRKQSCSPYARVVRTDTRGYIMQLQ